MIQYYTYLAALAAYKAKMQQLHKEKNLIIKECCYLHDYKWPKELWTGVMYFKGYKITIEEFNKIAKEFI